MNNIPKFRIILSIVPLLNNIYCSTYNISWIIFSEKYRTSVNLSLRNNLKNKYTSTMRCTLFFNIVWYIHVDRSRFFSANTNRIILPISWSWYSWACNISNDILYHVPFDQWSLPLIFGANTIEVKTTYSIIL